MTRPILIALLLFMLIPLAAFAQDDEPAMILPSGEATLAMTLPEYLVTPGDVYHLTYLTSAQPTELPLYVDANTQINVGFLGRVDAEGRTFQDVKRTIMGLVQQTYPNSHPELVIRSVGRYEVYLSGHVSQSGHYSATGLSRLGDVASPRLLPSSSTRRITILRDGRRRTYDLLAANRFGQGDQNPYVRPGDRVEIAQASRVVTVAGEVNRPGRYELLSGEHLDELVARYADGFTPSAATDRIVIDRGDADAPPQRLSVTSINTQQLQNGDQVIVPAQAAYLPAVTFQGAIIVPTPDGQDAAERDPREQGQLAHRFRDGETLGQALRANLERISPSADLSRAEYFRADSQQPLDVDLHDLLYDYQPDDDIELAAGDRIVVPFGTFEVFVTGEVTRADYLSVESLTRLSAAIGPRLTPYSSTRDVTVTSRDGAATTYDLFQAERFGRRDQNPYLSPGDTVDVSRANRVVAIGGEVRRPGTYQLLQGEDLRELVEFYGDGVTLDADPGRLQIARTDTEDPSGREILEASLRDGSTLSLRDRDRVTVLSEGSALPFIVLHGALAADAPPPSDGEAAGPQGFVRRLFRIVPGQSLQSFVRGQDGLFLPSANLRAAELTRADGTVIPVNLEQLLEGASTDRAGQVQLAPGDELLVPFQRPIVVVSGAVASPGLFAYVPGRSADYYVNLAGGYDPTRTWFRNPRVTGQDGDRLNPSDGIPPEATILVPANNPIYAWQIGTLVGAVSGVVSLLILIAR